MAIALVQRTTAANTTFRTVGSASNLVNTNNYSSTTTAGSLLLALVYSFTYTATPSVALSGGGTWTQASSTYYPVNPGPSLSLFYISNSPAVSSSTTITATTTAASNATIVTTQNLHLYEFSGANGGFDVTSAGANNTTTGPCTCGSITPAASGELLIALYVAARSGTSALGAETAGTGYTLGQAGSLTYGSSGQVVVSQGSQYNVSGSSGAQTPSFATAFTNAASNGWVGMAWAFKPGSGAVTVRQLMMTGCGV
jgi:hypothetical protein